MIYKNNMRHPLFSPSLMCADLLNLGYQTNILYQNGFDFFHIDVMDFHFVQNIALGFDIIRALKRIPVPKDIHLMVENVPVALKHIEVNSGDFISFHIETKSDIESNLKEIKKLGAKVGLVINPNTPLKTIYPFLSKVDLIHLMSVEPGFSGQPFQDFSYTRAQKLSFLISQQKRRILLGVDGGIGFEQIEKFHSLGVNIFVLGTTCLFTTHFEEQVAKFLVFKKTMVSSLENAEKRRCL